MPGQTPLGPLYCREPGLGHGTGAGRARSTGGVTGRLLSLESKVGFDSACVPLEEDGVKALARPVSVLKPSIVSRLPEDLGSRASLMSLEDIFGSYLAESLYSLFLVLLVERQKWQNYPSPHSKLTNTDRVYSWLGKGSALAFAAAALLLVFLSCSFCSINSTSSSASLSLCFLHFLTT